MTPKPKKDGTRFTLKFNPVNSRHREAVRILNEAGRGMASLVADALCMYAHYGAGMAADLMNAGNSGKRESPPTPVQLQANVEPGAPGAVLGEKEMPTSPSQVIQPVEATSPQNEIQPNDGDGVWDAVNAALDAFI